MSRWWIQRGIAWILMAVLFLSVYPVSAWEIQEGEKCGSVYGEIYVGSDGRAYYSENTERYLLYQKDGTVSRHTMEAGYARQWFYMINQKGDMQKVFCIEAGVDFHESGAGYSASSGLDSQYGMRLPETARKGIAMTLLYGWQSGRTIPAASNTYHLKCV